MRDRPTESVLGRSLVQPLFWQGSETAVVRGRVVEDVDLRFGGNDFTYKKLFHLLIEIVS